MPYIAKEDREKYLPIINAVVALIPQGDIVETGDAFDCFITGIEWRYQQAWLHDRDYEPRGNTDIERELDRQSVNAIKLLTQSSMSHAIGELNYLISSVLWKITGDDGKYSFRSYLKGCLLRHVRKVLKWDDPRNIALGGVFSDVIDECYRRKTAPYEDSKIAQHGDIV